MISRYLTASSGIHSSSIFSCGFGARNTQPSVTLFWRLLNHSLALSGGPNTSPLQPNLTRNTPKALYASQKVSCGTFGSFVFDFGGFIFDIPATVTSARDHFGSNMWPHYSKPFNSSNYKKNHFHRTNLMDFDSWQSTGAHDIKIFNCILGNSLLFHLFVWLWGS